MHLQSLLALLPILAGFASQTDASPIHKLTKREVPQEKSHASILTTVQTFLQQDNPLAIIDPVFGLLGNAAASAGQGQVKNTDCLQQAIADQAFTNAKASNDIEGMTAALTYRALERNTGQVGLASVLCTETTVNPEIGEISQHQDPASEGAKNINKNITLNLSKQIASIGGNPIDALKSGTFAPGDITDQTAKGNSCDEDNCIFDQILLVNDVTEDEINAAVAGITLKTDTTAGNDTTTGIETPIPSGCPAATDNTISDATTSTSQDTAGNLETGADTPAGSNNAAVAGIDVGQCTDFSMTFAAGLEGRKADEFSFEPTDQTNFNHGTALNPSIITQFMCDTFVNACAKSAATRDTCKTVAADLDNQLAVGNLQRDQGFADAWLSGLETAFGIQSTGTGTGTGTGEAAAAAAENTTTIATGDVNAGANITTGTVDTTNKEANVTSNTTASNAIGDIGGNVTDTVANDNSSKVADDTAGNVIGAVGTGSTTENNLQTFTGSLNGISATPIINIGGDRPFQVKNDTFVNSSAAFQRSCDQQFNGCANVANSGSGDSSVAACSAQKDQCNSAIPAA
ncbi:uncharacterized protein I206_103696 [Kwoniella pini CBS 10737]|uniref:Circumsporozoite protein n=1 Tax=Kwoniella pini CBS 10737 TaxID=1296096 RepID=A0A1B9I907_9TREE|nr:uncharacterized protein I206_01303 [Kwoniella pini CBS 10737]OCF52019.1 hypothetical protein I206_01303 [Kwoniella pini CBS 10737]